jgi:cell wall-associated NlpC family hydrolase
MRKIFLTATVAILASTSSLATPVPDAAKIQSKPTKSSIVAHPVKQTTEQKSKHSTNSHTTHHPKKKVKPKHRHSVPQIKPLTFNQQDNIKDNIDDLASPQQTTTLTAEAVQPVEPPKKTFHLFSWHNSDTDKTESNNSWTTTITQRITNFAHNTVANLHYSSYRFGGNRFDPQNGVYMLDCSGYVDNLLHQSSPKAYSILAQWSGSYKPNSEHYYNFFNRLGPNGPTYTWNKVTSPQELQAGDILVFRYKNSHGGSRGGHVMLVMDKAEGNSNIVRVRVADSAATGHSADTRGTRASGIGIGTLLLKVDPATGQPYAFAWRVDSPWNTRVSIAMGRPPTV